MILSSPIFVYLLSALNQNDHKFKPGTLRSNTDYEFPLSLHNYSLHVYSIAGDERRLYRHVLWGYDRAVRPVYNASKAVDVFMGLTLTHIFNIDERSQVMALNVWVEHYWHDERVSWTPETFGNISKLSISTKMMWTPDIVLYNNARDFSRGFVEVNLHVTSTGDIQFAPPAKVYSICSLDVSYFPFDDQFCKLEFRSWMYDKKQLDLQIMERYDGKTPFTRDSFTENGEWQIVANRTTKYIVEDKHGSFPVVVFELHLRRRMLYFLYNIIYPCVMLSILTLVQFILPCESGEKVTLGLTVLLAYSVFSFNIAESMPETSEVIPLIAIYLMSNMALSALSVALSVLVLNVRHGAEHRPRMTKWVKFVGFSVIGRLVGGRMKRARGETSHRSSFLESLSIKEPENEDEEAEWTALSHVVDRFCFASILLVTASTTIGLLILAPQFSIRSFDVVD